MVADPQGEIAQPSADVILWQGRALPLRGGADGHAMTGFGVVSRWRRIVRVAGWNRVPGMDQRSTDILTGRPGDCWSVESSLAAPGRDRPPWLMFIDHTLPIDKLARLLIRLLT